MQKVLYTLYRGTSTRSFKFINKWAGSQIRTAAVKYGGIVIAPLDADSNLLRQLADCVVHVHALDHAPPIAVST